MHYLVWNYLIIFWTTYINRIKQTLINYENGGNVKYSKGQILHFLFIYSNTIIHAQDTKEKKIDF